MLMGEYHHSLDEKGRLFVPARLREDLGEKFVLTKGLDDCLFGYGMEEWERLLGRMRQLSMGDPSARAFSRLFFAGAQEVSADKQGRILVPPQLREFGGLEKEAKEAVWIGVLDRVELWSEGRWHSYSQRAAEGYAESAGRLAQQGL